MSNFLPSIEKDGKSAPKIKDELSDGDISHDSSLYREPANSIQQDDQKKAIMNMYSLNRQLNPSKKKKKKVQPEPKVPASQKLNQVQDMISPPPGEKTVPGSSGSDMHASLLDQQPSKKALEQVMKIHENDDQQVAVENQDGSLSSSDDSLNEDDSPQKLKRLTTINVPDGADHQQNDDDGYEGFDDEQMGGEDGPLDREDMEENRNSADREMFNNLNIYESVVNLVQRHKVNQPEFLRLFNKQELIDRLPSNHATRSQLQANELSLVYQQKFNDDDEDDESSLSKKLDFLDDLQTWLDLNRLFERIPGKAKRVKYKNLPITSMKAGFKELKQTIMDGDGDFSEQINMLQNIELLLEIYEHKHVIKNYMELLDNIAELVEQKNSSRKRLPMVEEEIRQLTLQKGKEMQILKGSLEVISKHFIISNRILINTEAFNEKDFNRTQKAMIKKSMDREHINKIMAQNEKDIKQNKHQMSMMKTQFVQTLSYETPNHPGTNEKPMPKLSIAYDNRRLTLYQKSNTNKNFVEGGRLFAILKAVEEIGLPDKQASLILEPELKYKEECYSIRLLHESYDNETGIYYLSIRAKDGVMELEEDDPKYSEKLHLFFTNRKEQRSIWIFQKYHPQHDKMDFHSKGVWKQLNQCIKAERLFVEQGNKYHIRLYHWNWPTAQERVEVPENIIKDFEQQYYYLNVEDGLLKMQQADLHDMKKKKKTNQTAVMSQITIWTYEALNDKRAIDYEKQIHRLQFEQKLNSKQMLFDDIMLQLQQTSLDLSKVNHKLTNSFMGYPSFGHANKFSGRFEFWQSDLTANEDGMISYLSNDMMTKDLPLRIPEDACEYINENLQKNFGQFTRQGRISGNIYYYSQNIDVLAIHKLGTIDDYDPELQGDRISWNYHESYVYKRHGELFTLHELRKMFGYKDIAQKMVKSNNYQFYKDAKSIWIPFRSDDNSEGLHNFVQVRNFLKKDRQPIFLKTMKEVFGNQVPQFPSSEDEILSEEAFKGVIYKQVDEMELFKFPGKIRSVLELSDAQIIITFKVDKVKESFLIIWNGLENKEKGIYQINPNKPQQVFPPLEIGKIMPLEYLQIGQNLIYNCDRDLAFDFAQNYLYTSGPENQVFKLYCNRDRPDMTTFINQGSMIFDAPLISIRISNDFTQLYVATTDTIISIVNLETMVVINQIVTGIGIRDFGFSQSADMMVSTHDDGCWRMWKLMSDEKYKKIYNSENTGDQFFQVEFDDKDFYLTKVFMTQGMDLQNKIQKIQLLEFKFDYDYRTKMIDFRDKQNWKKDIDTQLVMCSQKNFGVYFILKVQSIDEEEGPVRQYDYKMMKATMSKNLLNLQKKNTDIFRMKNKIKYKISFDQLQEIPDAPAVKQEEKQQKVKQQFIIMATDKINKENCLIVLDDYFSIFSVVYFENQKFNQFRMIDHEHVAIWEKQEQKDGKAVKIENIHVYQIQFDKPNEIIDKVEKIFQNFKEEDQQQKNDQQSDQQLVGMILSKKIRGKKDEEKLLKAVLITSLNEDQKNRIGFDPQLSIIPGTWLAIDYHPEVLNKKSKKKAPRQLIEIRLTPDGTLEFDKLIWFDPFPDIQIAKILTNKVTGQQKLAILTQQSPFEHASIDQFYGQVFIWDIGSPGDRNESKFLLTDHIDLRDCEIQCMGFIQTQGSMDKTLQNEYLWYLTNNNEFERQKSKMEDFCIYSLVDNRVIYKKEVEIRLNKSFENVIIDMDNSIVYFVDNRGVYITDILHQKHDFQLSIKNFFEFCTYDKEQGYSLFLEQIGDYTIFPQMQNLIHLFSIEDLDEDLTLALQDPNFTALYHTDVNQISPIQLASMFKSDGAFQALVKAFDFCDQMFLTKDDIKILTMQSNPIMNLALDKLFQPSKFLDKDHNIERGQLNRPWYMILLDNITSTNSMAHKMFFLSKSRYLWFQKATINSLNKEYYNAEQGLFKETIDQNQQSALKIEYMTLQFKAPFLAGSYYSQELLELMTESYNRDLFRSEIKHIVDFKWDQLYRRIYRYNIAITLYFMYLIFVQLEPFDREQMVFFYVIHLVLTIVFIIPELFQNILTLQRWNNEGKYSFDDFQNNFELLGYTLQIVYSIIYMTGIMEDEADTTYEVKRDFYIMNLVSCLFLFIRGFFLLRVFDMLRPYVRMIKEVTTNMGPFTIILIISCFFLSVVFFMMHELHVETNAEDASQLTMLQILMNHVVLIAAGGYGDEYVNMSNEGNFGLFLIAFFLMFIVFLNLLISIISERFGIVLEQTIQMDCVERVSLMLEMENFIRLSNRIWKTTDEAQEEVFINFCRYMEYQGEGEPDTDIEVEGRIRYIQDKVLILNEEIDNGYTDYDEKKLELQALIRKLNKQQETNNKIREQQIEVNAKIEKLNQKVSKLLEKE